MNHGPKSGASVIKAQYELETGSIYALYSIKVPGSRRHAENLYVLELLLLLPESQVSIIGYMELGVLKVLRLDPEMRPKAVHGLFIAHMWVRLSSSRCLQHPMVQPEGAFFNPSMCQCVCSR